MNKEYTAIVEPHGFTAVAPRLTSAEPAEAYPPLPRLGRVTHFAFIVRRHRLWPTAVHGFTPVAFCEGG